jgi:hypothetical protein
MWIYIDVVKSGLVKSKKKIFFIILLKEKKILSMGETRD